MANLKLYDAWDADRTACDDGPGSASYYFPVTKEVIPGLARSDQGMSIQQLAYRVREHGFENAGMAYDQLDITFNVSETPTKLTMWNNALTLSNGNALTPSESTGGILVNEAGSYLIQTSVTIVPSNLDPGEYIGLRIHDETAAAQYAWLKVQVPFDLSAGDFVAPTFNGSDTNITFTSVVYVDLDVGDFPTIDLRRLNRTGSVGMFIGRSSIFMTKLNP